MRIRIANGVHLGKHCEIEIDKFDSIETIRFEIRKYWDNSDNNFLIYKNIILLRENLIAFYRISQNDEIWWGRIENYMKCDDVIIDIFLVSWPYGILINLIVNVGDSIADIKPVLNSMLTDGAKIIDIWNDYGDSMENNKTISELYKDKAEMRIICRLDDGDIDRSFDECCDIYDLYLVQYFWKFCGYVLFHGFSNKKPIQNFVEIILSFVGSSSRFADDVAVMAICLQHSRFLCCKSIADYFYDILFENNEYWPLIKQEYRDKYGNEDEHGNKDEFENSSYYLYAAIFAAVLDCVTGVTPDQLQWDRTTNNHRKLTSNIIREAVPYYVTKPSNYQHLQQLDPITKFKYNSMESIIRDVLHYIPELPHANKQQDSTANEAYKSIWNTICDAVHQHTIDGGDMGHLLKNLNKLFLKYRDYDWGRRMTDNTPNRYPILHKDGSSYMQVSIPQDTKTILQFKNAISLQTGTPLQQLYMIDKDRNVKPRNEDTIKMNDMEKYLFQIIHSMDDIKILEKIGRGSFGEILLCERLPSKNLFALKRPINMEKFNLDREIINHSMISGYSSNICRHRGIFSYQDSICSAMDYKSGGTLDKFIKKNKSLKEHEIARISHQILIQIKIIHQRGVIHRDIKPDNIVLDENNNVYLIDFGLSKRSNYIGTGESMIIINKSSPGASHYIAPELATEDSVTDKIDIWSFGVMVIEMVNGERPYHYLPDHAVVAKIIKEKKINFQLPETATEELRNFINSCVEFDQIKRSTLDELLQSDFIKKYYCLSRDLEGDLD